MAYNFIIYEEILKFGISEMYLRTALKNFRQGKSQSWSNKKDKFDKRKVLIDIDSIPEPTRKKYSIPTGKEYFEQKQLKEYNETQEKIQREKDLRTNAEKMALYDAYTNDYLPFVALYKERYTYRKDLSNLVILSAKEHAFWLKMLQVTGTEYKTFDGGCRRGFNLYMELKKRLGFF